MTYITHFIALSIGLILGFFLCAILTLARRARHPDYREIDDEELLARLKGAK